MLNKELLLTGTKKEEIPFTMVIGQFIDSGDSIHTGFAFGNPLSWYDNGWIESYPIWIIDGKEYTLSILETSRSSYSDPNPTSMIKLNLVDGATPEAPLSQLPWDMHVKTTFGSIIFPKSGFIRASLFSTEHEGTEIQVIFDPPRRLRLIIIPMKCLWRNP